VYGRTCIWTCTAVAADVNVSHFVRTACEDRSIVPTVKQFAGSCRSRAGRESRQQTAYARANYINPKGSPLVLDPCGSEAAYRLRLAPEKLPSIPTMTEATPTPTRGVPRIHFLLLSIRTSRKPERTFQQLQPRLLTNWTPLSLAGSVPRVRIAQTRRQRLLPPMHPQSREVTEIV
jgi:hypothetical protein